MIAQIRRGARELGGRTSGEAGDRHVEAAPEVALESDLELVQWLDRCGYNEAWFGEHHSAGSEISASPEIFIAAASERTRHIRLGAGVVSVSSHNPLWVAERIVMLDHLTRGRVMFGAGPGSLPTDGAMIGLSQSQMIAFINDSGLGAIGTPDMCAAQIERLQAQSKGGFGAYLLLAHNWANPQAILRNYDLIARHVMPRFQGHDQATAGAARVARAALAEVHAKAVEAASQRYAAELGAGLVPTAARAKKRASDGAT